MKNITLILIILVVASCKKTADESKTTEEVATENTADKPPTLSNDYKLSLAQWAYHVPIQNGIMDPMDFAEKAKELGFTGVEYVDQLYTIDSTLTYQDAVMKLAQQWDVKNKAFEVEPVLIMVDRAGELADPSEEKRKEAIQKHKYWVDAAAAIGAPSIRINLFGLTEPKAWHEACVASLKDLCAYAADKNISILTENHAQLSNDASKVVAIMKEVNMPNCKTLPDFGNFCVMREGGERWGPAPCIEEYDPYKGIEELMPYAGGVSAKSHVFDEIGDETEIDYYRMMQIVKDSGFKGYVGIEYENDDEEDPTAGILATKELVIKALNAAK